MFSIGDRASAIFGATADGRFYSLDAQMGRPALLLALGSLDASEAARALDRLSAIQNPLNAAGIDTAPIAPASWPFASAFANNPAAAGVVYVVEGGGLEAVQADGGPAAIVLDRSGRIVDLFAFDDRVDPVDVVRRVARAAPPPPAGQRAVAAPVLIVPNVASRDVCQALIAHFEASPSKPGVMAGFRDGSAYAKLDETKKRRSDLELTEDTPLYDQVLHILARRCAPEIKHAFQKDMTYVDRILIARYDETGGYFKRHRDNAAPQTRFREFAISINLNTEDYEGGELLFAEYDDQRYAPPTGGAIIFSASLLHEVAPVTKGRRYVLLSFFFNEPLQPGG